jgi:hypothetical protein
MHKIEELENRWFDYKVKKIILPALKVSALYVVVAGSYYAYSIKDNVPFSLLPSNGMTNVLGVSMDANNSIVEKVLPLEKITKKAKVVEKIELVPIIPVIDMEKEERISDVKRARPVKRVKSAKVRNTVKAKKNEYLTARELTVINKNYKKEKVVIPKKTKKMNFTSTSTNYIEMMKNKFSKSKTPRDALLLAKTYYKNANYLESEKWALSANKLDNSLEDSWLFFAKSKVKLGKKKEALKILVSYYKKSNSIKAKRLIGQIQTGKI